MSTAISILGGVGLFLLGMTVMTGGLKALAGSALRTVLSKAAATPLRGSFWGDYMHAFEEAIRATAAPRAPWFVVPADNKWFTRLIVAAAIVEAVEKLDLSYPKIDAAKKKELAAARMALARER